MRVLVTGGCGFIGRAITERLVIDGWDVTLIDRSEDAFARLPALVRNEARLIVGDTTDGRTVEAAVRAQDRIAHLAAGSSFLMYEAHPVEETTGAVMGFHRVVDAAVRTDVPRIVYLSTSAVYEGHSVPYSEEVPLEPPDLKAFSKKVNEELVRLYVDRYGIEAVGLRPFSVYGPGETSKGPFANVVSLFAWAMFGGRRPLVWGDGTQTRDFVAVDDVARAIALALTADVTGVFNVGTGLETSFNAVVELLNEMLGTDFEPERIVVPVPIYASRLLAETSRARRELGFEAEIELRTGIQPILDLLAHLDDHRVQELRSMQERFRKGIPRPGAPQPA